MFKLKSRTLVPVRGSFYNEYSIYPDTSYILCSDVRDRSGYYLLEVHVSKPIENNRFCKITLDQYREITGLHTRATNQYTRSSKTIAEYEEYLTMLFFKRNVNDATAETE